MKIKLERIDVALFILWLIFLLWDLVTKDWAMVVFDVSIIVLYILWLWWYQSREEKKPFRLP